MAHKINTMLATTYYLSSSQNINFSNDLTSSLTQVTVPIAYYTTFLINTASSDFSDGTIDKPFCLLQKVREKVGDYFDFTLSTDGKTEIRYRGYTTGSISFASSSVIKNLLGFTDTTITFNSGTVLTSAYQPYGAIFSINSTDTQGWETEYSQTAYSETAVGAVFGFKDDYFLTSRKQTLKFFPRDQDAKNQLATIPTTPIFPVSKSLISGSSITSNWGQPVSDPLSYSPPYTFLNFLRTSPGYPVRTVFGTFQENISGSNLNYDCVYLRPSFIEKKGFQIPSIKNYDLLRDVPDLEIILCNSGSISGVRTVFSGSAITATTAAFSPSDIANLYAWYKHDNLTLNGAYVSAALDKSGNGRHAVQATAGLQPLYYSSGGSNNKAYWNGVANTRYLLGGANNDFNFLHNGSDWTVVIVSKPSTITSRVWFGTTAGSSNDAGFGIFEYTNPGAYFIMGNGTVNVINKTQATGYASGSWHSLAMTYTTGSTPNLSYSFDNGSVTGTSNNANSNSAGNSGRKLGIGSAGNGSYITDTAFHEVILYNKKLSAGELAQIQTYLNTEYGL